MLEPVAKVTRFAEGWVSVVVNTPLTGEVREIFFEDDEAVAVYRALHDYIQGGH
jgi:hypothetical protein